jgi:glutamine synthetase adenylyltransferase
MEDLGRLEDRDTIDHRERHKRWLDRARIAGFFGDHVVGRIGARSPAILTHSVREMITEAFERTVGSDQPVAMFALGSFAVGEPRVFSDLDVIVVSDGANVPDVTTKVQSVNRWFDEGGLLKLDFRLRGEGASAPLVQDVGFYRQYFEKRMSLWERVAFAKCQLWWGDEKVAGKFLDALRAAVARPFDPQEVTTLVKSRKSIETLAPKTMPQWETKRSAGGRYDVEYLTAVGLSEVSSGDDYEFSLDTRSRLARLKDRGLLDEGEFDSLEKAVDLFTGTEYLIELQELSLPRTSQRAEQLEHYQSRSFDYWGLPRKDRVDDTLTAAKGSVRRCFERFMGQRSA